MVDQVRQVIDALRGFTEEIVKKVSLDVTANLIENTPVDTGWARANWVPSIGAPFLSRAGAPDAVSASEQQRGQAEVLTYTLKAGAVFVSNNVPYIVRLNDGASDQSPAMFVETAIQKAVTQDIRGT